MTHPKYQIIEVRIKDGIRTEEVVSKELMFKCDAERVVKYKNAHDAVFNEDFEQYWIVSEYKKGER